MAWKKAGAPINPKDLNVFMANYMKRNQLAGAYLVIEAASDDTRLRPYSVINETTQLLNVKQPLIQIKEAELKVKYTKSIVTDENG